MPTPTVDRYVVDAGWRLVLADFGVDERAVLRQAGLSGDLFSRPDARERTISAEQYFALWNAFESQVDDPLFPLRLTEAVQAASFSPPIFAALCSADLRNALQRLAKLKRLVAPMDLVVEDVDGPPGSGLRVEFVWETGVQPPRSMLAMELAFMVRLARYATRKQVEPLQVTTPYPPEPASAYTEFFGTEVKMGPRHELLYHPEDATLPFLTANEAMWSNFEPELRRRLAELNSSARAVERVQAALREFLPSGRANVDDVASHLAMSRRTLQRRLRAEGSSFADVLKDTRRELAMHYLERTDISAAEIALLLGFEEPTSFYRAFSTWTGSTPDRVRAAVH